MSRRAGLEAPTLQLRPLERQEAVSAAVARRLLDFLLSGQVKQGERIPSERRLALALGVGRSAIRDALKPLTLLGLVEVRVGDGTYLKEPGSDLLPRVIEWGLLLGEQRMVELVEARRHLEVVLAGLAADRRDAADLRDLRSLLGQMSREHGMDGFVELDLAFHLRVAAVARNGVLENVLRSIQALIRVWISRVVASAGETESSYLEHVPIVEAIECGDPPAASQAMAEHIDAATLRLRATLQP